MWTFNPIYVPTLWGGPQIPAFKQEPVPAMTYPIGESWELSAVEGAETVVSCGADAGKTLKELIALHGASLLGEKIYERYGTRFPLLIKFLATSSNLSVQVHPDDAMAERYGLENGKNEMWHIIDAEPGASVYNGFSHVADPEDFERLVKSGDIEHILNHEDVKRGDAFFVPAGRVHSIGKGILLAEIQQTSNTTYRIYDYHRLDHNGRERSLHIDLAREAIKFDDIDGQPIRYTAMPAMPCNILTNPYFTVNKLSLDTELMRNYQELDSFVVMMCIGGAGRLTTSRGTVNLTQGHTVLIGASEQRLEITPGSEGFEALECYI